MRDEAATIMLVHGAWHGSWCWEPVVQLLQERGFSTAVVDNPSVTCPGADLAADSENVRSALDAIEGPVVLVGHSYGGAVITEAGTHPKVEHLVYLTAFALDVGESLIDNQLTGGDDMKLAEALQLEGEVVNVEPARIVEFFYHDCAPEVAAAAAARLRPMSMAAMAGTAREIAWRERPSTYVVCTDDRAIPVSLQRACAQRVGAVVELATSHSPFLSRPDELARLLAGFVA
jgi:pimeloyl-ACP methyl ester carboxylesterase